MENASKALLMAAGVLIGLLIISLAVYLFLTFGAQSAELHKQIDENRLSEFNSQFTSYEGKDGLTIYDVITVANLATESNKYYELNKRNYEDQKDNYITVLIGTEHLEYGYSDTTSNINNAYNSKIEDDIKLISENQSELKQYECKSVSISKITGRVYKIEFKEK